MERKEIPYSTLGREKGEISPRARARSEIVWDTWFTAATAISPLWGRESKERYNDADDERGAGQQVMMFNDIEWHRNAKASGWQQQRKIIFQKRWYMTRLGEISKLLLNNFVHNILYEEWLWKQSMKTSTFCVLRIFTGACWYSVPVSNLHFSKHIQKLEVLITMS
jgi:hypothetical protein